MPDFLTRVQVAIPCDTGLPEDVFTNTWYFDTDSLNSDSDVQEAIMALLNGFYHTIDNVFYSANVGTDAVVKMYDMREATPRAIWFQDAITITPSATTGFPNEVAVCLSFQAAVRSGVPQARQRGRVFIGPVTSAIGEDQVGDFRLTTSANDTLLSAATTLLAGSDQPFGSTKWAVYSPTIDAGATVDDAFNDVDNGWCDNAFDTQRRRGTKATERFTFPA